MSDLPAASYNRSRVCATSGRSSPYLKLRPERQWTTAVESGSCFDMASNRGNLGSVEAILMCRPAVAVVAALERSKGGKGGGPEKSDDKVRGLLRLMQATDRCATGKGEEIDARRKAGPAILLHNSITGDGLREPQGKKGTVPRKDKSKKRADLRGSSNVSRAILSSFQGSFCLT